MVEDSAVVRSRLWSRGQLEAEDFPLERISDYLHQDGYLVWVDICDPDSEHLAALADELALDPLAMEDAVAHAERAKATRYADHIFLTAYAVATKGADESTGAAKPSEVS